MQIDRMELADLGNSLALAKALVRQLGEITLPVPIEDIAYAVGITDIQELETPGFEGALIAPDHKQDGVILVNRRSPRERKRFTIGHEIGHLLNPWHKPPDGGFKCTKEDMLGKAEGAKTRQRMETEANEFSAEVLMPTTVFQRDLRKLTSPGLEHVVELAKRYATSKLATARRFVDLHGEPVAIVLTKDLVVQHCHRHEDFPFIDLRHGQHVHKTSLTAKYASVVGDACSNCESTEPSLWCSKSLQRGAEMFEQVLVQSSGYRITLLSIDTSECDEDDECERRRAEPRPAFCR